MNHDPYTELGISPNATDDEVKEAYRKLVRKYHPDNYADDNPLKDLATEKMQTINAAYDTIMADRQAGKSTRTDSYSQAGGSTQGATGIYADIRRAVNARHFAEARRLLDSVEEGDRVADWHYLESLCLMNKGRVNDAMRELEIACDMDPGNMEYQKAKQMFNSSSRGYGSTYYGNGEPPRRSTTTDDVCDLCIKIKMLDCLCECMGGDLIRCC